MKLETIMYAQLEAGAYIMNVIAEILKESPQVPVLTFFCGTPLIIRPGDTEDSAYDRWDMLRGMIQNSDDDVWPEIASQLSGSK